MPRHAIPANVLLLASVPQRAGRSGVVRGKKSERDELAVHGPPFEYLQGNPVESLMSNSAPADLSQWLDQCPDRCASVSTSTSTGATTPPGAPC
jgi:hypothetical protein